MLYKQYKYKFYLNMNHSVEMEGRRGAVHSHTWEIAMGIAMGNSAGDTMEDSVEDSMEPAMGEKQFVRFSDIEEQINTLLEKYQDKYLNEIPPFNIMNPTLENVCNYLFELVSVELRKKGLMLLIMEMSETPSRVYQVTGIRPEDDYTFV